MIHHLIVKDSRTNRRERSKATVVDLSETDFLSSVKMSLKRCLKFTGNNLKISNGPLASRTSHKTFSEFQRESGKKGKEKRGFFFENKFSTLFLIGYVCCVQKSRGVFT